MVVMVELSEEMVSDRRRERSFPWNWTVAASITLLCLVVAFSPVLFGSKTLMALPGLSGVQVASPGTVLPPVMDTASAYIDEPLMELGAKQMDRGKLPLWNPHSGLGQPLLGNMQSAFLSPFRWPFLISTAPLVWDSVLLARLFVAGLLAFLLARSLGLGPIGSSTAGIAFSLSGYFVLHVNMHHLSVEVLAPGVLWAVILMADKPTSKRGLVLALFTWAAWVGGNPEATLFIALLAAPLLVNRVISLPHWKFRVVRTLLWAGLVTLLAAPFFLPGLELLSHGQHHHSGLAGLDHFQPWTAAALVFPGYFRSPAGGIVSLAPPWIGGVVLLSAFLGLVRKDPEARFPRLTFGIAFFLIFLKIFGFPVLNELGRLPILSMLLFYKYGFVAAGICLSLLAGRGIESLGRGFIKGWHFWAAYVVVVLAVGEKFQTGQERALYRVQSWHFWRWNWSWLFLLSGLTVRTPFFHRLMSKL